MRKTFRYPFSIFVAILLAFAATSNAQIRINEIMAAPSERVFDWNDGGTPIIGITTPWWQPDFNDSSWITANAPIGYGHSAISTNVEGILPSEKRSIYFRKEFTVSSTNAAKTETLLLNIAYDDGIIVFINGTEVTRRNMGPKGLPVFRDQSSYNEHNSSTPETIALTTAADLLHEGSNVIAIHLHDWWDNNSSMLLDAQLTISGSTEDPIFGYNELWSIFPGVIEPSGGVFDSSFLSSERPAFSPEWSQTSFNDSAWQSGTGPLGFDNNGDYALGTNLQSEMYGNAVSLYMRTEFTLTQQQINNIDSLELLYDYDDAFVSYLNGKELHRANFGATNTPVSNIDTPIEQHNASNDNGNPSDQTGVASFSLPSLNLVPGKNILSAQLHNSASQSSDMILSLQLSKTTSNVQTTLVAPNQTWLYFVGTEEPTPFNPPAEPQTVEPDFEDWIEFYNTSANPVDLTGWTLTDDETRPNQWTFPSITLESGSYLVVLASGLDIANTQLHTNFKLSQKGEYIGLYDSTGTLIDSFADQYPKQNAYHSYGYENNNADYRYLPIATPGSVNIASDLVAKLKKPKISEDGGHQNAHLNIEITSNNDDAEIRYTLDGSDPSPTNGTLYTAPLDSAALATQASNQPGSYFVIRAAAFKDGYIPSKSITRTFLFDQPEVLKTLPAIILSGDEDKAIFGPYGMTAMQGNFVDNPETAWFDLYYTPTDHSDYNLPTAGGRAGERPISFELDTRDNRGYAQSNIGARVSASGYSKPRVDFRNIRNGFGLSNVNKPMFNIFWRDQIDDDEFDFPVYKDSAVDTFDTFRIRSGKNDDVNPFIRDELCRRVFTDMGQQGSIGINAALYLNGEYQGYYNMTERLREKFFVESHNDDGPWFVKQVGDIVDGDAGAYWAFQDFLSSSDFSTRNSYEELAANADEANVIDYLMINAFVAMWDWPGNNYVIARSESAQGKYRLYMWDAEGSFGLYGNKDVTWNTFTEDLYTSGGDGPRLYRAFIQSEEFKLHFADRVQKQFFANGALTTANWDRRYNELKNEMAPVLQHILGEPMQTAWYTDWMGPRRSIFFDQLRDQGLWPDTATPSSDTAAGIVETNTRVHIQNTQGSGTIYYTLNGSDPRGYGGSVNGTRYADFLTIIQSSILKARTLNNGEWSPLLEVPYIAETIPEITVTEIMYHPLSTETADDDDLEFLELFNPTDEAIELDGLTFSAGIEYTFPDGTILAAGEYLLLVSDTAAFAAQYPNATAFGAFEGKLSNKGELIELRTTGNQVVFSFKYKDSSPWPRSADGNGFSLAPTLGDTATIDQSAYWRASSAIWGSPGATDPQPLANSIWINEILAHTDLPDIDTIELYNPNDFDVDISGWFLSDNKDELQKYEFPTDTILDANGYAVVTQADFDADALGDKRFSLSSTGETISLASANAQGVLTGFIHEVEFSATANGISLSRYRVSGDVDVWFPSETNSFGAENAASAPPAVAITEVLYDPIGNNPEFIEILNISETEQPLYDTANPTNTWKLKGTGFDFPEGASLALAQTGLIVNIEPSVFRTNYAIPSSIAIWGPYNGKLSNDGEYLALMRPDAPNTNQDGEIEIPYLIVDAVEYSKSAPWPELEGGDSITRLNLSSLGHEATNWKRTLAANTSPGKVHAHKWQLWLFLTFSEEERNNNLDTNPTQDFDDDEWLNLLEYATGLDPRNAEAISPVQVIEVIEQNIAYTALQVRINPNASDIEWTPQISTDLETWTNAESSVTQHGPDASNPDGTVTRIYKDSQAATNTPSRFIRIKIKLK